MTTPTLVASFYFALGLAVLGAWGYEYLKRLRTGGPESFWPGTSRAPWQASLLIAAVMLLITVAETAVERRFGVVDQQSVIAPSFLLAMLGASIIEEAVFRGFTAPSHFGGAKLLALIVVGSLVFSAIHGFDIKDTQGRISTLFAFLTSIWLYVARFNPLNPERSLIPCFTGHAVRNLAVFGIKWAQGFINAN
jgi:membrane protease YdiL (CAAX protease family)